MVATKLPCAKDSPFRARAWRRPGPSRSMTVTAAAALFCLSIVGAPAAAQSVDSKPSRSPVQWYDRDMEPIPKPKERDPNLIWDSIDDTIFLPVERFANPVRMVRRIGTAFGGDHVRPAQNTNSLDEVMNSSWFTNRIGLFPMTPEEVAAGPGTGLGPSRAEPWTVVSAKTQGVTPGFNIRDANGDVFLIKFDPKGYLGMTTCAGVVCTKIFHASGYNVPDDVTVTFRRGDLRLGENVRIKLSDGTKRTMTEADLDEILNSVDRVGENEWFAISSKFLDGVPIGPFNYHGRREDDPNDRINHQDRRELRGLEIFCSWLNHFDTKQHNTLDMYVGEDGEGYVKHHLIDFASTLGSGANGPTPRYGSEFTVDAPATLGRLFTLGLYESAWRRLDRPEGLTEVGYFVADDRWDPIEFKPLQPNTAFAHRTGPDGYWAAKIITAFTDDHLDAIVESAGYRDPRAAEHVLRVLKKRRDRIGRAFFDEIAPLEFFTLVDETISFRDLGTERNVYRHHIPSYQVRIAGVDANRDGGNWSEWKTLETPSVHLDKLAFDFAEDKAHLRTEDFVAVEARVRRHEGWSPTVTAYIGKLSGQTVEMRR